MYVYVIGRFPVVFGINTCSASSEVLGESKIGVAECYFPSKTSLRELFIQNSTGNQHTVAAKKKFTHRFRATETIQQRNGNNTEMKRKHNAKPETQNCTKTEQKIANKTETTKRK